MDQNRLEFPLPLETPCFLVSEASLESCWGGLNPHSSSLMTGLYRLYFLTPVLGTERFKPFFLLSRPKYPSIHLTCSLFFVLGCTQGLEAGQALPGSQIKAVATEARSRCVSLHKGLTAPKGSLALGGVHWYLRDNICIWKDSWGHSPRAPQSPYCSVAYWHLNIGPLALEEFLLVWEDVSQPADAH